MQNTNRVLYLTYDGLTDPLGQSQILPYLRGLNRYFNISIISFEKSEKSDQIPSITKDLQNIGIEWHYLGYTKKPPVLSTVWDVYRLKKLVHKLHNDQPISLIHCRSYITSLVGLSLKKKRGIPFLFDMRDFWADERVDGGLWNLKNPIFKSVYNFFKKKEQEFQQYSDAIITLTHKAKMIIGLPDKTHIIPTCVDIDFFSRSQQNERNKYGIGEKTFVLSYVGSTGTWYRTNEVWKLFRLIKNQEGDAKLLIISRSDHELIKAELISQGIDLKDAILLSAKREEMPGLISMSNWSAFFYEPKPSKAGTSPTRLAELVCQKVPVIANSGVGDLEELFGKYQLGYLVDELSEEQLASAADFILRNKTMQSDPSMVYELFDLDRAIDKYQAAYWECLK